MNRLFDDIIHIIISFSPCVRQHNSIYCLNKYYSNIPKKQLCFFKIFEFKTYTKKLCKLHNHELFQQYYRITKILEDGESYNFIHFKSIEDANMAQRLFPFQFGRKCCGGKGFVNNDVQNYKNKTLRYI